MAGFCKNSFQVFAEAGNEMSSRLFSGILYDMVDPGEIGWKSMKEKGFLQLHSHPTYFSRLNPFRTSSFQDIELTDTSQCRLWQTFEMTFCTVSLLFALPCKVYNVKYEPKTKWIIVI